MTRWVNNFCESLTNSCGPTYQQSNTYSGGYASTPSYSLAQANADTQRRRAEEDARYEALKAMQRKHDQESLERMRALFK